MPKPVKTLRELLETHPKTEHLSDIEVGRQIGFSHPYWYNLLAGHYRVRRVNRRKICRYLGITSEAFEEALTETRRRLEQERAASGVV